MLDTFSRVSRSKKYWITLPLGALALALQSCGPETQEAPVTEPEPIEAAPPAAQPEPTPQPEPIAEPAPAPAPAPEPTPEVAPEPEPKPKPKPKPQPAPEPAPEPKPAAAPEPEPEPAPPAAEAQAQVEVQATATATVEVAAVAVAAQAPAAAGAKASPEQGNWLSWRGPLQTGVSLEHYGDGAKFNPEPVWTADLVGRGTPVIHDGQLYSWSYSGKGPDLYEVVTAHNAETGEVLWERKFHDFLSDTVYNRYTVGSAVVDPETGNLFLHTTYGLFMCLDRQGNTVWEISLMERYGRLTMPNGRAGAPVLDSGMVITRAVTSYWGAEGPARDRFFAFDKTTGDLIWSSTPGVGSPYLKDTSFSTPYFMTRNGRRVFYAGTGCGNVVCVNVADGTPLWRFQLSVGGVNASPVIIGDKLIELHGTENMDNTDIGRMVALKLPEDDAKAGGEVEADQGGAPKISNEIWRSDLEMFTSSPTPVGDRIYQVVMTGDLNCVDANTGKILWKEKLGLDQIHASPAYVDGLLYIPINQGLLYVIRPSDAGPEILHRIELDGECLGSPAVCNGLLYVHTTEKLYAFRIESDSIEFDDLPESPEVVTGPAAGFAAVPAEVLLEAGDRVAFKLYKTDANGNRLGELDPATVTWEKFIPPTAKVKAEMDAGWENGELVAGPEAKVSAGMFKGTVDGLSGFVRGRVIESIPYSEDFEANNLVVDHPTDGVKFAFPPLPWIGARLKWEVRELEGNKVLTKTLDNILFQRSMAFFGHPDSTNYTMQADVMTDGNRRVKSTVGLVNQRYIIALIGNSNEIQISSNYERVNKVVKFPVDAKKWYTLKTRVDVASDGSGVIRAKVWEKGTDEPETWTIEVEHRDAHKKGAPGIFGFSPGSKEHVYIDDIKITQND